jgi:coenzyme F420-reducing hydrogenase alpha subunit
MTEQRSIRIHVPVLARVEGEGALHLTISNNRIEELNLKIYEPPRLFEKLLEGREYHEVPDMVARICGICPVAYQMSAVNALEQIFALQTSPWVQTMRRVFYCGEWIQSHALHIHLLAAPDFLGFNSAPDMAAVYPDEVRRGLRLQSLGNNLMALFGARSVHPVGACVGGFHHAPDQARIDRLIADLEQALPDAEALITWVAALDLPDDPQDFCSVSLQHESEYPMMQGRLVSDQGLDIAIENYEQHFTEYQVPHSTALHAALDGKPYLVGPLARMNLNSDKLPESTLAVLQKTGIRFPGTNMFHSIVARAAEIHFAILEAVRLLKSHTEPDTIRSEVTPRAGTGYGCTEAPRGVLWHKYTTDGEGNIISACIVPPTSQNQARIEQDVADSLQGFGLDQPEDALRLRAETVIRNYDPCISCATHFLKLRIDRR